MHRAIPVSNKKLSKLWNEKNLSLHMKNLRKIKSRVDLRSPGEFAHLKFNAKNLMIQEERISEIERENRILLTKMTQLHNTNSSTKSMPKLSRSLNKGARKRKLVQITIENQAMMKRIGERRSEYNTSSWEFQRKRVEKMLGSICEYPYTLGSSQKAFKPSKSTSKPSETPKSSQGVRRFHSAELLVQKTIKLSGQRFLVEIKKSQIGFSITSYKINSIDSYTFDVPYEEALEIMGSKQDFNKLIAALKMDGDDMILVEYKAQGL